MGFKALEEINTTTGEALNFLLLGYEAIDQERQLALSTTNGRTRNARRWFVHQYSMPSGKTDWGKGKITFRAWNLREALERLNEPRISARINKQFQPSEANNIVTQNG